MIISASLAAQLACLWEASAAKPGNVHRFQDFPELHFVDMIASAMAIGPELDRAPTRSVGETIAACVRATRRVVATNTNLGIILLFAPLAAGPDVQSVLARLTVDDARATYEAIRLARPGGLGTAPTQDIASEPTVTLLEAMRLAADRDLIARQYVTDFADVDAGVEFIANRVGESLEHVIVELQRYLLARHPDTLVARKLGWHEAEDLTRRARNGDDLTGWFADRFPRGNPGATADLVAASLFASLLKGIIRLPLSPGWVPYLP